MSERFCPQCGNKIKEHFKFCPKCGWQVPEAKVGADDAELFALTERMMWGDFADFTRFCELTRDAVYANVRMHGVPESDVEDVCQNVYIDAWQSIEKLSDARAVKGWIGKIAANKSIDFIRSDARRNRNLVELPESDDFDGDAYDNMVADDSYVPENLVMDDEEREATKRVLEEAFASISEDKRAILTIRFMDGMKIKDIAAKLEMNESTVKTRIRRGAAALDVEIKRIQKREGVKLRSVGAIPLLLVLFGAVRANAKMPEGVASSLMAQLHQIMPEAFAGHAAAGSGQAAAGAQSAVQTYSAAGAQSAAQSPTTAGAQSAVQTSTTTGAQSARTAAEKSARTAAAKTASGAGAKAAGGVAAKVVSVKVLAIVVAAAVAGGACAGVAGHSVYVYTTGASEETEEVEEIEEVAEDEPEPEVIEAEPEEEAVVEEEPTEEEEEEPVEEVVEEEIEPYSYFSIGNSVYGMDNETGETWEICTVSNGYYISDVTGYGGYVYFTCNYDPDEISDDYVCKVSMDGGSVTRLAKGQDPEIDTDTETIYYITEAYNSVDEWVEDTGIASMGLSGENQTTIISHSASYISKMVCDGKLYYRYGNDGLYVMDLESGASEQVMDSNVVRMFRMGGKVYVVDDAYNVSVINVEGGDASLYETLDLGSPIFISGIFDGYMYYFDSQYPEGTQIWRLDLLTQEKEQITVPVDGSLQSIYAAEGDWIVFNAYVYTDFSNGDDVGVGKMRLNGDDFEWIGSYFVS